MLYTFAAEAAQAPVKRWETRYMRAIFAAVALTAGIWFLASPAASAAPAAGGPLAKASAQSSSIIDVSGRCGPHRHRGPHGHCRWN